MNNNRYFFFINISIILLIFLVDQISKYYVINFLGNQSSEIFLTKYLNINLIWNDGIAFGLLSFNDDLIYNSITIIIFLVIIIVLIMLIKVKDFNSYFYAMIIGGASGNFVDRIRHSSVPDFIDFHILNYHWFIFNIADIFVSLGVFCLIMVEIFFNDKTNEKN